MIGRDAIQAALASVEGLAAYPSRPDTPAAGAAWPAWASTRWLNMRDDGPREVRWYAYAILPNASVGAAVDAGDPLVEAIGRAMSAVQLRVELVEPVSIQVADRGEAIPALRFTLAD